MTGKYSTPYEVRIMLYVARRTSCGGSSISSLMLGLFDAARTKVYEEPRPST